MMRAGMESMQIGNRTWKGNNTYEMVWYEKLHILHANISCFHYSSCSEALRSCTVNKKTDNIDKTSNWLTMTVKGVLRGWWCRTGVSVRTPLESECRFWVYYKNAGSTVMHRVQFRHSQQNTDTFCMFVILCCKSLTTPTSIAKIHERAN